MRLSCPTLDIENEEATIELLETVINRLPGKDDPYLILEKNNLTYMQAVCADDGFYLEFQEGSIDEHFQATEPLSQTQTIEAFSGYLNNLDLWKHNHDFEKKEIRSTPNKIGYSLGKLLGSFFALFKN